MKLSDQRREYGFDNLSRASLRDSPFAQFSVWMDAALAANIQDPTAMTLTTVNGDAIPWSRIVLLKGFDDNGFRFYTHLDSRKGKDIAANPHVTLHFAWLAMDRQVIVGGTAAILPSHISADYFASRPRESQIAAWVSAQSAVIGSRAELDSQFTEATDRFQGKDVPMPPTWGGFRVSPLVFEFWQGGEHRLHDRFQYRRQADASWSIDRLAP
jgi:pyridoxamine 5'-phosphate oxidase